MMKNKKPAQYPLFQKIKSMCERIYTEKALDRVRNSPEPESEFKKIEDKFFRKLLIHLVEFRTQDAAYHKNLYSVMLYSKRRGTKPYCKKVFLKLKELI